jgi:hypothetical protein
MKWAQLRTGGMGKGIAALGVTVLAISVSAATAGSAPPRQPAPQFTAAADETVTIAAVGDLCGSACNQTAALVTSMNPTALLLAGDLAYSSGTAAEFKNNYDPQYGKFKSKTIPAVGNHEYGTSEAKGYFDYFNGSGVNDGLAGVRGKGWHSHNIGAWHVVALNSEVSTSSGSEQEKWLRADLAANTRPCTIATWHKPRFSNGDHHDTTSVGPLFQALYDFKADLLITGHDHNYERFAPARPNGTRDDVNGLRQYVVGTGGISLRSMASGSSGPSEKQNSNTHGVLKLTLSPTNYKADFVPVAGRTFTDTASGNCKKANANPAFDVAANPVSVARGGSATSTVTVASRNGFSGTTTLTAANLPAGVTGSFNPATVTPTAGGSATSTLTLTASSTATLGTTTAKVTGTSGSLTAAADLGVTVRDSSEPPPGGFTDNFETDKGWTVNASGTDSATTGKWERGDPEQTANAAGVKQLGTTVSGVSALSTGRLAGTGYGANDLDNGSSSIRSPAITVPAGAPRLSFSYNVAHDLNSGPDDYLRVQVVDGATVTTVFEKLGTASDVLGAWKTANVDLSAFAGRSVRLSIEAKDGGPLTLFEAQVDDLVVNG